MVHLLKFIAIGQGTKDIRSRLNLARSVFSRMKPCFWSRREISLRTKGRVCQTLVPSVLHCYCKMWTLRTPDERMLAIFSDDCILNVRLRDCRPTVELQRRTDQRPPSTQPRTWRRQTRGHVETWATTRKGDFGCAQWRKGWGRACT